MSEWITQDEIFDEYNFDFESFKEYIHGIDDAIKIENGITLYKIKYVETFNNR